MSRDFVYASFGVFNCSGLSKGVGFVRYDTRMEAEQAIKHLNGTIPSGAVEPVTVKFANSPTSLAAGPAAAAAAAAAAAGGIKNNGLNIPAPVASPSYIAAAAAAAAASRRMLGQLHNPATGKIRSTPSVIQQCLQPAEADAVLFLVCLSVRPLFVCLSVCLSVRPGVCPGLLALLSPRLPIPLARWLRAVRSSLELILVIRCGCRVVR